MATQSHWYSSKEMSVIKTKDFLRTSVDINYKTSFTGVLILLIISIGALVFAPFLMPDNYSWIIHTTSESAAQGVQGAWLARLGFVCYGFSVIWLAFVLRSKWFKGAVIFHTVFGVLMISTAVFSIRPWMEGIEYDVIEDFLHSFTSTAMGFAFSFGIVMVLIQRKKTEYAGKIFDVVALTVSVLIPLAMFNWPEMAGLIQRLMFLVSYVWYAKEAFNILAQYKE